MKQIDPGLKLPKWEDGYTLKMKALMWCATVYISMKYWIADQAFRLAHKLNPHIIRPSDVAMFTLLKESHDVATATLLRQMFGGSQAAVQMSQKIGEQIEEAFANINDSEYSEDGATHFGGAYFHAMLETLDNKALSEMAKQLSKKSYSHSEGDKNVPWY